VVRGDEGAAGRVNDRRDLLADDQRHGGGSSGATLLRDDHAADVQHKAAKYLRMAATKTTAW
jgi:hypothetical protein